MTAAEQPIRTPKTAELIAERLRGRIVRGELAAGATLPSETDLMQAFGVSRPTLREAFRILETESLIQVRRGARGGAQVTPPQLSVAARHVGLLLQLQQTTVADVYEARSAVEALCARRAAQRKTKALVTRLRAALDGLAAAVSAEADPPSWPEHSEAFHGLLVDASGNRTLALQGRLLQAVLSRHIAPALSGTYGRTITSAQLRKAIRSHGKLVDLIAAGDGPGAEEHWRRHMEVAGRSLFDDVGARTIVELFA